MNIINKHLKKLNKKEEKLLNKKQGIIEEKIEPLIDKVEAKVPEPIKNTLERAFYKSFNLIFEKGTKYIEKLYDKNKIQYNHNVNDYAVSNKVNRRTLKKIDKYAQKSKLLNTSITTIEGAGLGILGVGIPDIPLFTAMILKTIYEISLNYGFLYEIDVERVYILNLIKASLTTGELKHKYNLKVDKLAYKIDNHINFEYNLDREIINTARILSDSMLTTKFIQGIPLVGVVGSISNYKVINKISEYSIIKYKKRYLSNKK